MKPYKKKYKDSGIEWIGEIPEHWEIKKIKHNTYLKARVGWKGLRSDEFLDEGFSFLLTGTDLKNGKVDWEHSYFIDKMRYDDDPFIQLKENDLLITKDGTIGKVAIVDELNKPACLNSGVFVMRPLNNEWETKYLFNVLSSNIFKSFVDFTSYGSTILHLYQNVFNEFQFPLPPIKEQKNIVDYLNFKTTEIDQNIADKEQLITLYEEEKKALINQAVTKGLNPKAKQKPSGVDWLGDIPEHWEVKRLKQICSKIGDGIHATPEYVDESSYYFINGNNLGNGNIVISDTTRSVSRSEFEKLKLKLNIGTVLLSINGTIGNLAFYKSEEVVFGKSICYMEFLNEILLNQYAYFLLQSDYISHCFETSMSGTTIKNLSLNTIRNLKSIVPPLIEQEEIIKFVEKEASKIRDKIHLTQQEIALLKEYRQALVFEAVTGKINVNETVKSYV